VTPSEDALALLQAQGYRNVTVIPNGVDLERFRPQPQPAGPPFEVLGVGRAAAVKGVRVAVAAVERVREQHGLEARLCWVGPRAVAAGRRIGSASFEGCEPVPAAELPARYAAAHVVVVPSLARETFGLAALEGLACGRPVIVSDRGGLPEVVGSAGLVVPAGDVEALAAALAELLGDPARRLALGEQAAARARESFAWGPIAERYLALMRCARVTDRED
jgi:glycosyltransferase involved in cell wall biosynthesis